MAKRNALSSLRMRKELSKLKESGYKFRSDVVVCNKHLHNKSFNFDSLGIQKKFTEYPIYKVDSYFVGNGREVVLSADFSTEQGSLKRIELGDLQISKEVRESGEFYNLCYGDDVPDVGLYDEPLYSFELLLPMPFFYELFEDSGVLMGNNVLWGIFYDKEYRENCEISGRQYLCGLDKKYSSDIIRYICTEGFTIHEARRLSSGRIVVEYHNKQGTVAVKMYMEDTITIWYVDLLTAEAELDALMKDSDEEGVLLEDLGNYEIGQIASISDINSLRDRLSFNVLNSWRYRSVMLNNEPSDAIFKCRDLEMKSLLEDLSVEGFSMISLGVANMLSTERAVVSCGFFNGVTYLYISFYYSREYGCFLVSMKSFLEEQYMLEVNNTHVFCTGISFLEDGGFITFIQGFDFEELSEAGLVS